MFRLLIAFLIVVMTFPTQADDRLIENFSSHPEMRWKFIADTVMGGISSGELKFNSERGETYARMTGNVSTENNGGFIQIRKELNDINLSKADSIRIVARGNNERYYIFLRTTGTILPWQYYSYEFDVRNEYDEFIMPIKDFKKSGMMLANQINPKKITSIGIVAYGRDHYAELYVKELEFLE